MSVTEHWSDEGLLAYLDGTLDPAESEALERAVEADPELEARLMALDGVAPIVAESFQGLGAQARMPSHLGARRQVNWGLTLVAASVALVVGLGLGRLSTAAQTPSWTEAVASYQALYVADTIAPLEGTTPDALAAQLDRSGAMIDAALTGLLNMPLEGAELRRAQVLALGDAPIIQIVFEAANGTPLALCILERSSGGVARARTAFELQGMEASYWQTERHEVLLIGRVGEAAMRALTASAQKFTADI